MLTTYPHTPVSGQARSADYLLPSDLHRRLSVRPRRWSLCRSTERPIVATLACRSGGFRSLVPTRRACRLRLGWPISADLGQARHNGSQWVLR